MTLIEPLGVKHVVLFTTVAVGAVTTGFVKVLATAADLQPDETNLATTLYAPPFKFEKTAPLWKVVPPSTLN